MTSQTEQDNEYCQPSIGEDVHKAMRTGPVEVGGKEKKTEELMRPQTGESLDG